MNSIPADTGSSGTQLPIGFLGKTLPQLARLVEKADLPGHVIRSLPAQTLHLISRYNGLEASTDLIQEATLEQCRLMLDFDCWQQDEFSEDRFFEWLAITDAHGDLGILQKLLTFVDLKLISLLIYRYVNVIGVEEPSDVPPEEGYYTPDKGYTWISVAIENEDYAFYLKRFLALIFETDSDLFYQLLALPASTTETILLDESYQDKERRLVGEGIPDAERTFELHQPLTLTQAQTLLAQADLKAPVKDIFAVEPLVKHRTRIEPFSSFLDQIRDSDSLMAELTLLMNAGLIFFKVNYQELENVEQLSNSIRGAINIGIERLSETTDCSEAYAVLGLSGFYRLGLEALLRLRNKARSVSEEILKTVMDNKELFSTLAGAREQFPVLPLVEALDEAEHSHLAQTLSFRAFEHMDEIDAVLNMVDGLITES